VVLPVVNEFHGFQDDLKFTRKKLTLSRHLVQKKDNLKNGVNAFIGHYHFFLRDPDYHAHKVPGYPERVIHGGSFYGEFFFNFVFAATATTIISGSLAERVEFGSYLVYGVLATGFIQPVTVHWAWSNGWLVYPPSSVKLPPNVWYRDYAGGGNVHAVGGAAALVGCLFIGPRIGRFEVILQ